MLVISMHLVDWCLRHKSLVASMQLTAAGADHQATAGQHRQAALAGIVSECKQ